MKSLKFLFARIFLASVLISGANASIAYENYDEDDLPVVHIVKSQDFRADAKLAQHKRTPILVLFSMEGCSYCTFVEEEHLKPMLRNANYGKKVIIRKVMSDSFADIIDFNGKSISAADFATRYGAYMTPTVVFLDHNGKPLSRITGVRNTEFYGGELDDSLNLSLTIIRGQQLSMKKTSSPVQN